MEVQNHVTDEREERWSAVAAEAEVDRPLASVASQLVDGPWRLFQAATGSRTGHL